MFLLKNFYILWDFGKCLLIKRRKILLDTALLNGGLNQIILRALFFGFCLWFLVYLKSPLNPIFFTASSSSHFAVLNISSFDNFFDSLCRMEFGICFMTSGEWFKELCCIRPYYVERCIFFIQISFFLHLSLFKKGLHREFCGTFRIKINFSWIAFEANHDETNKCSPVRVLHLLVTQFLKF